MKTIQKYLDEAKKIFVTIDVDYWNPSEMDGNGHDMTRSLSMAIDNIPRRKITTITNHHQVLGHIYKCKFDLIVNIDSHSDLRHKSTFCDCGNWLDYLTEKQGKRLLWIHDLDADKQGCCERGRIFPRDESHISDEDLGYLEIASRKFNSSQSMKLMKMIVDRKSKISGLNICRSPHYSERQQYDFLDIANSKSIRIKRGVLAEDNCYCYTVNQVDALKYDLMAGSAVEGCI